MSDLSSSGMMLSASCFDALIASPIGRPLASAIDNAGGSKELCCTQLAIIALERPSCFVVRMNTPLGIRPMALPRCNRCGSDGVMIRPSFLYEGLVGCYCLAGNE